MRAVADRPGEDGSDGRPGIAKRLDQKLLSLLRLKAARVEDVIAQLAGAQAFGSWRRMIKRLAPDLVVTKQAFGDLLRVGEDLSRFGNKAFVTSADEFADARPFAVPRE